MSGVLPPLSIRIIIFNVLKFANFNNLPSTFTSFGDAALRNNDERPICPL